MTLAHPFPISDVAERHAAKVQRVARTLRARTPGTPVSIQKKAVSHQVPKRNDRRRFDAKIDLTDLDEVLAIDVANRTCTAEPGVTFTDLVEKTLAVGLVPMVVPELRTITIGGAVSGCSLESMSFRYGGFHDSCLEYEVVTAKGDVLRCSPTENPLVFQMMHGSFGTLGLLTKLVFRLVPAKKYVHLVHEKFGSLADYKAAIRKHTDAGDLDFMDGFVFGKNEYVLCAGYFTDHAPYSNRYDWLKVYFESTRSRTEDYLETADYFFRYDNGVTNVHPKTFLGRLLFGKFLHSAEILRIAEKIPHLLDDDRPNVTVDTFIPFSKVDAFLDWWGETFDFWPLWCVPYRRVRDYEWIANDFFRDLEDDLFLDLAIYGMKQEPGRNVYKEIEDELDRINAIKTLISYNYYDADTFWRIFNKANYDAVKKITDPENLFRDLYGKTCRAAQGKD
jgi:FAD/FMN-containing dehydrogenase